jgi:hypothetical protein
LVFLRIGVSRAGLLPIANRSSGQPRSQVAPCRDWTNYRPSNQLIVCKNAVEFSTRRLVRTPRLQQGSAVAVLLRKARSLKRGARYFHSVFGICFRKFLAIGLAIDTDKRSIFLEKTFHVPGRIINEQHMSWLCP